MTNPNTLPTTTGNALPPFLNLPWGQVRENGQVYLGVAALEFLQFLFASLQGNGGVNDALLIDTFSPAQGQVAAQGVASVAALFAALAMGGPPPVSFQQPAQPEVPLPRLREIGSMVVPWTPALVGSTTAGVQTYTTQWGWSIALGPVTLALYSIALSAVGGTIAGNALITGLPVAAALTGPDKQAGWVSRFAQITLAAGASLGADVAPGASQLALVESVSAGAVTALPVTALANTSAITGGVCIFR